MPGGASRANWADILDSQPRSYKRTELIINIDSGSSKIFQFIKCEETDDVTTSVWPNGAAYSSEIPEILSFISISTGEFSLNSFNLNIHQPKLIVQIILTLTFSN